MVEAVLDHCMEFVNDYIISSLDCANTITASTDYRYCLSICVFNEFNYSSFDLGLPLWLGGVPNSLPFVTTNGINACIRNVLINNVLLDMEQYVSQENTRNGCPQVNKQIIVTL